MFDSDYLQLRLWVKSCSMRSRPGRTSTVHPSRWMNRGVLFSGLPVTELLSKKTTWKRTMNWLGMLSIPSGHSGRIKVGLWKKYPTYQCLRGLFFFCHSGTTTMLTWWSKRVANRKSVKLRLSPICFVSSPGHFLENKTYRYMPIYVYWSYNLYEI